MTKDWDSVQGAIFELSVNKRKSLEEVKNILETKHKFRASTRAYRMKLKEWGYTRHKPRKPRLGTTSSKGGPDGSGDETDDSSGRAFDSRREYTPSFLASPFSGPIHTPPNRSSLLPTVDVWAQGGSPNHPVLMEMLQAVCEDDPARLDQLCATHPSLINFPIGLPFDVHGTRFFNHPVLQTSILTQHVEQTLLDVAAGFPFTETVYVLLTHGAHGSKNAARGDLALGNAIRNSRAYTVSALIDSNRSSIHVSPCVPLLQAVSWNLPEIVAVLVERGADVNTIPDTPPFVPPLQTALDHRAAEYGNPRVRQRSSEVIRLLLDAGANIHTPPRPAGHDYVPATPFQTFLQPWQPDPLWVTKLSPIEIQCMQIFIARGANLQVSFPIFPCSAPTGHTFAHQLLWHASPLTAGILVDSAATTPILPSSDHSSSGAGSSPLSPVTLILHELLGACPDAKRHPGETLRDIDMLLQRGADPNSFDEHGCTPLAKCLQRSAHADVEYRLRLLLDAGADPECPDGEGQVPVVLATRLFEESVAARCLEALVARYRGVGTKRDNQGSGAASSWAAGYFPVPRSPTAAEVMAYFEPTGAFAASVTTMLPPDVAGKFQIAAFSVASWNFLSTRSDRSSASTSVATLGGIPQDREDVSKILNLRDQAGLPRFKFSQDFIMAMLNTPSPPPEHSTPHARSHSHHPSPVPSPLPHMMGGGGNPQRHSHHGGGGMLSSSLAALPPATRPAAYDPVLLGAPDQHMPVSVPMISILSDEDVLRSAAANVPVSSGSDAGSVYRRSLSTASCDSISGSIGASMSGSFTPRSLVEGMSGLAGLGGEWEK